MKYRKEVATIKTRKGQKIPGFRIVHIDTRKNLAYVDKRKALAERATKELGVACFG